MANSDFENLTPDRIIDAVEDAMSKPMSGLASPLPSYINRVYETQAMDGQRLIAKFYRPGRWSLAALREEHAFIQECAAEEIPVIAPLPLANGDTLSEIDGIYFTVFPKRYGRQIEMLGDERWRRVGSVLGRVHMVGARHAATARVVLDPNQSTARDVEFLLGGPFVPRSVRAKFEAVTSDVLDAIGDLFDDVEYIRVHGDCHHGNILDRPDEGLMMIDFDDMMTGPPVQDLWMLLPERGEAAEREFELTLEGYERFRRFDRGSTRLIEPLRAMRVIYYLAWQARQFNDYRFKTQYPEWGSETFWHREVADLREQLARIEREIPQTAIRRSQPKPEHEREPLDDDAQPDHPGMYDWQKKYYPSSWSAKFK